MTRLGKSANHGRAGRGPGWILAGILAVAGCCSGPAAAADSSATATAPAQAAEERGEPSELEHPLNALERALLRAPKESPTWARFVRGFEAAHGADALGDRLAAWERREASRAAALLLSGLWARDRGQPAVARDKWKSAAELNAPELGAEPMLLLAGLELQAGRAAEAAEWLEQALALDGALQGPDRLQAMEQRAEALQRAGDQATAAQAWRAVARDFSQDARAMGKAAEGLASLGEATAARELLETLRQQPDATPQARFDALRALIGLARRADDEAAVETLLRDGLAESAPGSWQRRQIAEEAEQFYSSRFQFAALVAFWESYLNDTPDDVDAILRMAQALNEQGDAAQAGIWLERAAKRVGPAHATWREWAAWLVDQDRLEEAVTALESVTAAEASGDHWRLLGQACWSRAQQIEDPDASKPWQERAFAAWRRLAGDPPDEAGILEQVNALESAGAGEAARDVLTVYLNTAPSGAGALRERLVNAFLHSGETNEALAALELMAAQPDDSAEASLNVARLFGRLGRWDRAGSILDAAMDQFPSNMALAQERLDQHLRAEQWDAALALCDAMRQTAADAAGRRDADRLMMTVLRRAGRLERWRLEEDQAVRESLPGADIARAERLVSAWLLDHQVRPARSILDRLLEHHTNEHALVELDAATAELEHDATRRLAAYERLLILRRQRRAEWWAGIVEVHRSQGAWKEALAAATEWVASDPSGPTWMQAARIAREANDPERAEAWLQRSIRDGSEPTAARIQLAEWQAESGQRDEAIATLEAALQAESSDDLRRRVVGALAGLHEERGTFDAFIGGLKTKAGSAGHTVGPRMGQILAAACLEVGRPVEASRFLGGALAADPRNVVLWKALLEVERNLGDAGAQVRCLQKIVLLDNTPDNRLALAEAQLLNGEADAVLARMDAVLRDARGKIDLAQRLAAAAQISEQSEAFARGLAQASSASGWEEHFERAKVLSQMGQWEEAAKAWRRVRDEAWARLSERDLLNDTMDVWQEITQIVQQGLATETARWQIASLPGTGPFGSERSRLLFAWWHAWMALGDHARDAEALAALRREARDWSEHHRPPAALELGLECAVGSAESILDRIDAIVMEAKDPHPAIDWLLTIIALSDHATPPVRDRVLEIYDRRVGGGPGTALNRIRFRLAIRHAGEARLLFKQALAEAESDRERVGWLEMAVGAQWWEEGWAACEQLAARPLPADVANQVAASGAVILEKSPTALDVAEVVRRLELLASLISIQPQTSFEVFFAQTRWPDLIDPTPFAWPKRLIERMTAVAQRAGCVDAADQAIDQRLSQGGGKDPISSRLVRGLFWASAGNFERVQEVIPTRREFQVDDSRRVVAASLLLRAGRAEAALDYLDVPAEPPALRDAFLWHRYQWAQMADRSGAAERFAQQLVARADSVIIDRLRMELQGLDGTGSAFEPLRKALMASGSGDEESGNEAEPGPQRSAGPASLGTPAVSVYEQFHNLAQEPDGALRTRRILALARREFAPTDPPWWQRGQRLDGLPFGYVRDPSVLKTLEQELTAAAAARPRAAHLVGTLAAFGVRGSEGSAAARQAVDDVVALRPGDGILIQTLALQATGELRDRLLRRLMIHHPDRALSTRVPINVEGRAWDEFFVAWRPWEHPRFVAADHGPLLWSLFLKSACASLQERGRARLAAELIGEALPHVRQDAAMEREMAVSAAYLWADAGHEDKARDAIRTAWAAGNSRMDQAPRLAENVRSSWDSSVDGARVKIDLSLVRLGAELGMVEELIRDGIPPGGRDPGTLVWMARIAARDPQTLDQLPLILTDVGNGFSRAISPDAVSSIFALLDGWPEASDLKRQCLLVAGQRARDVPDGFATWAQMAADALDQDPCSWTTILRDLVREPHVPLKHKGGFLKVLAACCETNVIETVQTLGRFAASGILEEMERLGTTCQEQGAVPWVRVAEGQTNDQDARSIEVKVQCGLPLSERSYPFAFLPWTKAQEPNEGTRLRIETGDVPHSIAPLLERPFGPGFAPWTIQVPETHRFMRAVLVTDSVETVGPIEPLCEGSNWAGRIVWPANLVTPGNGGPWGLPSWKLAQGIPGRKTIAYARAGTIPRDATSLILSVWVRGSAHVTLQNQRGGTFHTVASVGASGSLGWVRLHSQPFSVPVGRVRFMVEAADAASQWADVQLREFRGGARSRLGERGRGSEQLPGQTWIQSLEAAPLVRTLNQWDGAARLAADAVALERGVREILRSSGNHAPVDPFTHRRLALAPEALLSLAQRLDQSGLGKAATDVWAFVATNAPAVLAGQTDTAPPWLEALLERGEQRSARRAVVHAAGLQNRTVLERAAELGLIEQAIQLKMIDPGTVALFGRTPGEFASPDQLGLDTRNFLSHLCDRIERGSSYFDQIAWRKAAERWDAEGGAWRFALRLAFARDDFETCHRLIQDEVSRDPRSSFDDRGVTARTELIVARLAGVGMAITNLAGAHDGGAFVKIVKGWASLARGDWHEADMAAWPVRVDGKEGIRWCVGRKAGASSVEYLGLWRRDPLRGFTLKISIGSSETRMDSVLTVKDPHVTGVRSISWENRDDGIHRIRCDLVDQAGALVASSVCELPLGPSGVPHVDPARLRSDVSGKTVGARALESERPVDGSEVFALGAYQGIQFPAGAISAGARDLRISAWVYSGGEPVACHVLVKWPTESEPERISFADRAIGPGWVRVIHRVHANSPLGRSLDGCELRFHAVATRPVLVQDVRLIAAPSHADAWQATSLLGLGNRLKRRDEGKSRADLIAAFARVAARDRNSLLNSLQYDPRQGRTRMPILPAVFEQAGLLDEAAALLENMTDLASSHGWQAEHFLMLTRVHLARGDREAARSVARRALTSAELRPLSQPLRGPPMLTIPNLWIANHDGPVLGRLRTLDLLEEARVDAQREDRFVDLMRLALFDPHVTELPDWQSSGRAESLLAIDLHNLAQLAAYSRFRDEAALPLARAARDQFAKFKMPWSSGPCVISLVLNRPDWLLPDDLSAMAGNSATTESLNLILTSLLDAGWTNQLCRYLEQATGREGEALRRDWRSDPCAHPAPFRSCDAQVWQDDWDPIGRVASLSWDVSLGAQREAASGLRYRSQGVTARTGTDTLRIETLDATGRVIDARELPQARSQGTLDLPVPDERASVVRIGCPTLDAMGLGTHLVLATSSNQARIPECEGATEFATPKSQRRGLRMTAEQRQALAQNPWPLERFFADEWVRRGEPVPTEPGAAWLLSYWSISRGWGAFTTFAVELLDADRRVIGQFHCPYSHRDFCWAHSHMRLGGQDGFAVPDEVRFLRPVVVAWGYTAFDDLYLGRRVAPPRTMAE